MFVPWRLYCWFIVEAVFMVTLYLNNDASHEHKISLMYTCSRTLRPTAGGSPSSGRDVSPYLGILGLTVVYVPPVEAHPSSTTAFQTTTENPNGLNRNWSKYRWALPDKRPAHSRKKKVRKNK
jgi:hypothetical protein